MNDSSIITRWRSFAPYFLGILRIVTALLFIQPGTMKLFGFPAPMPGGGTAQLVSLIGLAGILEVFGGVFMLLGLFTRPIAFILSGEMAVAYFMGHAPNGFWPIVNHGELAIIYCFIWLYFSAAGAGLLSIDALRGREPVVLTNSPKKSHVA